MGRRGRWTNLVEAIRGYPHVRGEKALINPSPAYVCGSSPRAWGKGGVLLFRLPHRRIIPTCVGKRVVRGYLPAQGADHPHVRGEKGGGGEGAKQLPGSSPRAWGKDCLDYSHTNSHRIIPTCVGKRCGRPREGGTGTDHPHVRGEKMRPPARRRNGNGSSPRAWGKGFLL